MAFLSAASAFLANLKRWILLIGAIAVWVCGAKAQDHQSHPGYLDSVQGERNERVVEKVLPPPLDQGEESRFNKEIFEPELEREFIREYENRFGRTEAERNVTAPGRFDEYEYTPRLSVSIEEDQKRKRGFGEYMLRRLSEHHIDQYLKADPSMRPVYEMKDRISRLELETKQGYKARFKYSFSGNYFELKVDNPYELENRISYQFGSQDDGTGLDIGNDTTIALGKNLTKTVNLSGYVRLRHQILTLVATKTLRPGLGVSLTGQTHNLPEETRQLLLVGLTWTQ